MLEWLFILSAIAGLLSFFASSIYKVWKGRDPSPLLLLTALCCVALIVSWWKTRTVTSTRQPPRSSVQTDTKKGKKGEELLTGAPTHSAKEDHSRLNGHSPRPPDPALAEALTIPGGLPGANSDGGSGVWPFHYTFTAIDRNSGAITGQAEVFTGGPSCVFKLEGALSGDTLEFKWAGFVMPCNSRLAGC